jgi:hypothetical protein
MLIPDASHSGASAVLAALFKSDLRNTVPGNMNILRPHGWFCETRGLAAYGNLILDADSRSKESIHPFAGSPKDRRLH